MIDDIWRYIIILIALAACSPAAPLQPTTAVDVVAATPANTSTPPLASTAAASPLPPVATKTFTESTTIRMALADQSSAVDTSRAGWWSIQTLRPVGQTFKPAFAGLDAVELWTEDQWDAGCSGVGATLQVNLREATIDGPLLGSSAPVALPDCYKGVTFFGFPSLIPLTPDKVYVVEVSITSEDSWGVVWQQDPDTYLRGESIILGAAGHADLWFREGLRNSTPPTEAYCQSNLWRHVTRADGSAFNNQGDCLQYVDSGR